MKLFVGEFEVPSGAADYAWTLATGLTITVHAPDRALRDHAADCAQAGVSIPVRGALAHASFWVRFLDVQRLVLSRVPLAATPEAPCP